MERRKPGNIILARGGKQELGKTEKENQEENWKERKQENEEEK